VNDTFYAYQAAFGEKSPRNQTTTTTTTTTTTSTTTTTTGY